MKGRLHTHRHQTLRASAVFILLPWGGTGEPGRPKPDRESPVQARQSDSHAYAAHMRRGVKPSLLARSEFSFVNNFLYYYTDRPG